MSVGRASIIVFRDLEALEQRAERAYDSSGYGLYGTPTSRQFEDHIAPLEGGVRASWCPRAWQR